MRFEDFSGLRVLAWFLENPTRRIHFKGLCRELGLGPLTVKTYCEGFLKRGWILEERGANLRVFFLNNEDFVVKAVKRAHFLARLKDERAGLLADDSAVSLALYGSHASGEFDEKSDVDMLVIGHREHVGHSTLKRLEKRLKRQIQLTVLPLEKWEKNKTRDPFMLSVLKNHVVLKGAPL